LVVGNKFGKDFYLIINHVLNMSSTSKYLALIFIFVVLPGLFVFSFNSVTVQAMSVPPVPNFSIDIDDLSYDVPSSTTVNVDPFTGEETIITTPGYRVNEIRVTVEIENLPDRSYSTSGGDICKLYYRVQYKGHFEENWRTISLERQDDGAYHNFVGASNSQYTPVTCVFTNNTDKHLTLPPSGGQLDFRVQALYAYLFRYPEVDILGIETGWYLFEMVETQTGDWSSAQTITLTYESSQAVDRFQKLRQSLLIVVFGSVCIVVVLLAVITYLLRHRKYSSSNGNVEFVCEKRTYCLNNKNNLSFACCAAGFS